MIPILPHGPDSFEQYAAAALPPGAAGAAPWHLPNRATARHIPP